MILIQTRSYGRQFIPWTSPASLPSKSLPSSSSFADTPQEALKFYDNETRTSPLRYRND
ncbi:hypothetical protein V4V36_15555 [Paenibacillus lautus]|uniref:hypothetical protein n=1 Tax=Paenibacillus lautus TaxID=1401 RepID=UPI002FBDCA0B